MARFLLLLVLLFAVALGRSAQAFLSHSLSCRSRSRSRRCHNVGIFVDIARPNALSNVEHGSTFDDGDATEDDEEDDASEPLVLQKGKPEGFYIIQHDAIPTSGFDMKLTCDIFGAEQAERVGLTPTNFTAAAALMVMYRDKYPSLSKTRKALRKGYIIVHRGPLNEDGSFDQSKCIRARVNDRIYPGDVLAEQSRLGNTFYPKGEEPPFPLPVVYEDDHFAIVNKPAGVNVNSHRKSGIGQMCVRAAAPYVLEPPAFGTRGVIRRPSPVHRLDKPTSGLLLIAKTKPAMVDLTRQLKHRVVKKTYTAIVNGLPKELDERAITSKEAHDIGVDVGYFDDKESGDDVTWQHISKSLVNKNKQTQEAVTVWRPLKTVECPKAKDGHLTLVLLKPKSGRYHQLRKHMAMSCDRPLVGDKTYSGNIEMKHQFLNDGLYLCSNAVSLEHPYYNTDAGRLEWEAFDETDPRKYANGMIRLSDEECDDGQKKVLVHVELDLPERFQQLLDNAPSLTIEQDVITPTGGS